MNDDLDTESIRKLLDRSLSRLGPATLARLSDARQHALAARPAEVRIPVSAGSYQHSVHTHHRIQQWGLILLLLLGILGGLSYWHQLAEPSDSEVDIAILTDDLPVEMYAD
jgi:hypothetical protein